MIVTITELHPLMWEEIRHTWATLTWLSGLANAGTQMAEQCGDDARLIEKDRCADKNDERWSVRCGRRPRKQSKVDERIESLGIRWCWQWIYLQTMAFMAALSWTNAYCRTSHSRDADNLLNNSIRVRWCLYDCVKSLCSRGMTKFVVYCMQMMKGRPAKLHLICAFMALEVAFQDFRMWNPFDTVITEMSTTSKPIYQNWLFWFPKNAIRGAVDWFVSKLWSLSAMKIEIKIMFISRKEFCLPGMGLDETWLSGYGGPAPRFKDV